jgi:hypothetical protein
MAHTITIAQLEGEYKTLLAASSADHSKHLWVRLKIEDGAWSVFFDVTSLVGSGTYGSLARAIRHYNQIEV